MKRRGNKTTIWVIRAGRLGETDELAHDLFISKSIIVLESQMMGDLRQLQNDRHAFYAAYRKNHPDSGDVSIRGVGGKFFRFIYEIKFGDIVLYPYRNKNQVRFGSVVGPYNYQKNIHPTLPHSRKVQWVGEFNKCQLTVGAVRELGGARSLFMYKSNANEVLEIISKVK